MPVQSSTQHSTGEPARPEAEQVPRGRDRGRVSQEHTGPNGPFLEGASAEHLVAPEPGPREEVTRDEAAEAHVAARVREALRDHGDIDPSRIDVVVDGDHVVLRGSVRSHWAHHYAGSLASAVDGVGSVQNDLEIERNEDGTEAGGPTADTAAEELPKKHYP